MLELLILELPAWAGSCQDGLAKLLGERGAAAG